MSQHRRTLPQPETNFYRGQRREIVGPNPMPACAPRGYALQRQPSTDARTLSATTLQFSLDECGPCVETASWWRMKAEEHWRYRLPGYHLVLLESGTIEGTTPRARFRAEAGELVCYPPSDRNDLRALRPALFFQMIVRFAPLQRRQRQAWLQEVGPLPLHVPLGSLFAEARSIFEAICIELPQPGVVHRLRTQAAVYQLLALMAAAAKKSADAVPRLDSWQRIRLRIASTPSQPIRVADLARELGIGADHFNRQFRRRFGISPKQYHMDARIREAARLLRDPARSITSVAYELGFPDAKSLTRVVKRHLGISMSALRQSPQATPVDATHTSKFFPPNYIILAPGRDMEWVKKEVLKA
jgi:AraC-like DNA-binding protein